MTQLAKKDWQSATVTGIKQAADDMISITLKPEHWTPHRPGQCYETRIPNTRLMRKYSVVSAPSREGSLEFGVQMQSYGAVSPKMWQLKTGDKLDIRGPFGTFVLGQGDPGPVVLIGGGSGITPLISMHSAIKTASPGAELLFIVSAKNAKRIMHYDILRNDLITRFTTEQGRVDKDFLNTAIGDYAKNPATRYFVSGPNGFYDDMVDLLLEMDIPNEAIMSEGFN